MRYLVIVSLLLLASLTVSAQDPLTGGGWRGYWQSEKSGHHGPMRATVRQLSESEYRVWFAGRFAGVIPFVYPAKFTVTGVSPTGTALQASQYLGPGLGEFRTTATATPMSFVANYTAKRDHGRFVLTRR
jgi:hypothetical protein